MTNKQYQDIKSLFLKRVRNQVIYVPLEDFLQECFAGFCEQGGEILPGAIKESIKYAQRHTQPPQRQGKRMYEIPIGIPERFIEHPRQFTREY